MSTLVEMGLITREEQHDFGREWQQRSEDPVSFLCFPPMFDVIGVKR